MLCTDIDGTLLNKKRELSKATISEIRKIKDNMPIVLISSRMPSAMRHLQEELGISHHPFIAYNGGLVMYQEEILQSTEIDNEVLDKLIQYTSKTTIHVSLYQDDSWYVPSMDFWALREQNNTKVDPEVRSLTDTLKEWKMNGKGAHKIMCMGDELEINGLYKDLERTHFDDIVLYRSKPTYIEIANRKISKKTAIESLLASKFPNISMNDIIAFGDNYNDVEMLQSVGHGVAVANAKEAVRVVANELTKKNTENGVALSIQRHFNF